MAYKFILKGGAIYGPTAAAYYHDEYVYLYMSKSAYK